MSPLDATHAFRSPERLAQLVASIAQGDDTVVEATWVEWKSQWSLTHDKWRRAGAARHMIGFANRDPDRAASFAEGWAYLVLGLEPGNVVGFPIADPADLSAWLRPYVGDSLRWHPEFTQHDGKNILVEVWKYGSSVAMNLQVRDSAGNAYDPPGGVHQSPGVIFPNGKRRPSFTAFRFPFVVRRSHGRLQAWLKAPRSGRLTIQHKLRDRWHSVTSARVERGNVYLGRLPRHSRGLFRAVVGGKKSLPWRDG